jgi:hypothetical protein
VGEFCVAGATIGARCPSGFTTDGRGAWSRNDCGCFEGLYETVGADGQRACVDCPGTSTRCDAANTKLEALPLAPGFWRQSVLAVDIRPCFSPAACLGGPNVTTQCAPSQRQGSPYCAVCAKGYYGGGDGVLCQECEGSTLYTFLPAIAIGSILVLIIVMCVIRCVHGDEAVLSRVSRVSRASREVASFMQRALDKAEGAMVKLRILIACVQRPIPCAPEADANATGSPPPLRRPCTRCSGLLALPLASYTRHSTALC